MISVLDHIEYLSYKHDCVIVPGFGAFISQYSSTNEKGIISSLNRNITFNASIDYNDGLLINSLMRRERISSELAKNLIAEYVCCIRTQLKHEGEIPLGRLGYFKYINDNAIEFNPFITKKSNSEYYGLSRITLKPLFEDTTEDVMMENKNNIVPFTKKLVQVAASIILLICLSLFLSTPIVDLDNTNYANLNAFNIKNHKKEQLQHDLYIAIPKIKNSDKNVTAEDIETERIENKNTLDEGKYCIVIASLATQKQAEKFIQENGIKNCNITKSIKKYRVYVARGSYDEMIQLKKTIYSDTDAWVCKI